MRGNKTIKSPSDTTIYAPALNQLTANKNDSPLICNIGNPPSTPNLAMNQQGGQAKFVNDISSFIESVRIGMKNQDELPTASTSQQNGSRVI